MEAEPSKKGLWIGIAAAAVIALAVGGYFLFGRSSGVKTASAAPPPAAAPAARPAVMQGPPSPATAVPAAPAGLTPEEIQAQIQQMFEAKEKQIEAKYQSQYDDRIKQLQQQLEASRRASAEPERQPERAAPEQEPTPAETRTAQRTEPAVPPPAPATQSSVPAPQPAAASPQVAEEEPAASAPAPASPPPVQAAAPRQPQVQVGDLVQAGPGVVAPKRVSLPEPRYPPAAQRLNRAATVDIKVLVDEKGRVLDAELLGAKAGFGFDEAALDAARRAVFQPATKEGVRVKMWATVRVNFQRRI